MALSDRQRHRRLLTIAVLVGLIAAHLVAVYAYYTQARQQALLVTFLEAREQWKDGHLDEAAATYSHFLAARPTVAWPIVLIRHYPNAADAWYLLGRVESDRHETDAALAAYAQSMASGGRGARETRELLLTSGRLSELLNWATKQLEGETVSPQPLKDRAAALFELGRPQDALQDYRAAIARLPNWRRQVDPAAPAGLSGEEADLWNLYAAAALAAGDRPTAVAACAGLTARQAKTAQLDRLCRALIAQHDGQAGIAKSILKGYLPPAAEHEWLIRDLVRDTAP